MAPEILLEKPYSQNVDLWSLGILSYFLLSGNLPFYHEKRDAEITKQIIKAPLKFKEKIWDEISPEAKSFVHSNAFYLF